MADQLNLAAREYSAVRRLRGSGGQGKNQAEQSVSHIVCFRRVVKMRT
jgi:hypothetical protein